MEENYNINGRITMYKYNSSNKYKLQRHSKLNFDIEKMFYNMALLEKSKHTDICDLDYPIDLKGLEEYIELISTRKMDNYVGKSIKNESVVTSFVSFVEDRLGPDCQILFTKKSLNNILRRIDNLPSIDEKYDIVYLYDGINFYIYNPSEKEMVFLFPIKMDDMYKIFNSNKKNYENELLVQFFEQVYGSTENDNPYKMWYLL